MTKSDLIRRIEVHGLQFPGTPPKPFPISPAELEELRNTPGVRENPDGTFCINRLLVVTVQPRSTE